MQASRDDRLSPDERGRHSTQTLVTAVAVLILAGGAYLLAPKDGEDDEMPGAPVVEPAPVTPVLTPPQPTPAQVIAEAPDIPEEAESVSEPEPAPESEPEEALPPPSPPTQEEIDADVRAAVAVAGIEPGSLLNGALAAPYLLDRGVSSLDQLARGLVPKRTLNLAGPAGAFSTRSENGRHSMDPAGYGRYDAMVAAITALPADGSAALFQQLRPMLREAYAALGYPADMMDNTLIAALDAVIAAPVRETPPVVVGKGALWAYEDETLESASDLHKQLLRTGPENTRALQAWASELRAALLAP